MANKSDQKQIFKIIEKLPEEVKEVLFSEKTADYIDSVCKKYGAPSDKISDVAKFVGQVLLGILSLEELPGILEKEVSLKKSSAKNIAQEIELSVFSQIRGSLGGTPAAPPAAERTTPPRKEEPPRPRGKDIYHEPIA